MFFPASLPRMVQNFVFGSLGSASESVLSQVLQRQTSSSLVRSVLRALISGWVGFDSRIWSLVLISVLAVWERFGMKFRVRPRGMKRVAASLRIARRITSPWEQEPGSGIRRSFCSTNSSYPSQLAFLKLLYSLGGSSEGMGSKS